MRRILIVRMSALGDIVHALPVLAAIRAGHPAAEIDWLADRVYAGVLGLVEGLNHRIIGRPGLVRAVRELRARDYDVAIDLQGLLKSAVMARASGARRVIGFEGGALREPMAARFYGESIPVAADAHVIHKNLGVLPLLGLPPVTDVRMPFIVPSSSAADRVMSQARVQSDHGFVLLNPGAAWPNKRWAPARFGALARRIRDARGLPSFVLWGAGEASLADEVVAASSGAASRAPETTLGDLLALCARAALMVSGDTGPLHLAAAMQTPIVGLYGPTWPARNGPWDPRDVVVSRAGTCVCHHKRQCRRPTGGAADGPMCINEISVDEVFEAVARRLDTGPGDGQGLQAVRQEPP